MVANSESVVSHFGYWPTFADGTVLRFSLDSGDIELSVRYGDSATRKVGEVDLRFKDVSVVELDELREQNILDLLELKDDSPIRVRLEAAYGLYGSFACKSVSVAGFRALRNEL